MGNDARQRNDCIMYDQKIPWTRQPQGPVEVAKDRFSKPLTFAYNAGSGPLNLVDRRFSNAIGAGVSVGVGSFGRATVFNGSQPAGAFSWGDVYNPFGGSSGLTIVATLNVTLGSARKIFS